MPLHLRLKRDGTITHVGPTLRKMRPEDDLLGRSLFEVFDLKRPSGAGTLEALTDGRSHRLQLQFRDAPRSALKGLLVPDNKGGEYILNLSFGISLMEAIHDYDLSSADFAHTDLVIEMLYVVEAKTVILDEWRGLNARLQSAKIEAETQAYTDTLTGLRNRRALDKVLQKLCDLREPFGLVHLDLDFFKQVNDTLGHAAGDHVLQVAAQAMIDATRSEDTLVRAGGDEFVLILPGVVNPGKLMDLSQRLIRRLQQPIPFGADLCRISGSAGIAVSLGAADASPQALLKQADRALYASKGRGRSCATVFSSSLPPLSAE
ncbi:MAG: diguanylate cyclase [Rhodobacteraceae bacterium]|nr:diguanylate cyclase [Paracoccaceae bacterium]